MLNVVDTVADANVSPYVLSISLQMEDPSICVGFVAIPGLFGSQFKEQKALADAVHHWDPE